MQISLFSLQSIHLRVEVASPGRVANPGCALALSFVFFEDFFVFVHQVKVADSEVLIWVSKVAGGRHIQVSVLKYFLVATVLLLFHIGLDVASNLLSIHFDLGQVADVVFGVFFSRLV